MSESLALNGGFETQTTKAENPNAEVNYSLLERRFEQGFSEIGIEEVELLEMCGFSSDPQVKSLGINELPNAIRQGIVAGTDHQLLDRLRDVWLANMKDTDEEAMYEAQQLFVLEEARLVKEDQTTLMWLGQHVTREWFN